MTKAEQNKITRLKSLLKEYVEHVDYIEDEEGYYGNEDLRERAMCEIDDKHKVDFSKLDFEKFVEQLQGFLEQHRGLKVNQVGDIYYCGKLCYKYVGDEK